MSLLHRNVLPRPGRPTRMMISFCLSGRRLLRRPAELNVPLDLQSGIPLSCGFFHPGQNGHSVMELQCVQGGGVSALP